MKDNFRRVHFFNGMLATEEDWNAGHEYHRSMRKFHNQEINGVGVIRHFRESLLVRATQPAGLRMMVQPGAVIDPDGREILLLEPKIIAFNPDEFAERGQPFSGFVFLVIRYDERPEAFAVSATDARVQGHKRISETAAVALQKEEPQGDGIELARIYWSPDCSRISDAVDFHGPRPGEIDLRFVPYVGVAGGRLDPVARAHLLNSLTRRHKLLGQLAMQFEVSEAHLPRPTLVMARTLVKMSSIDRPAVADAMRNILDSEEDMIALLKARAGEWERVCVSNEFKKYLELIHKASQLSGTLENGPMPHMESMHYKAEIARAVDQFRQINDALDSLLQRLPEMLTQQAGPEPYPDITAEELAVWSKPEMPRRMALNGTAYVLVDQLDVTNVASEEAHRFRIDAGPKDVVEGSTPSTYPGGGHVTDSGISYRRGSIHFLVGDLVPGKDMLLIRRVEMRDLQVEEELRIDDQVAGNWRFEGDDEENAWRNVLMGVNGEFIAGPRPRLRLQLGSNSSPSNLYRLWVYQAR